jgi:hypothetical protein
MIEVSAKDLPLIKAKLKELGDGNTIPRELAREVRSEVPPLRDSVQLAALVLLPRGGGLNRWVAASKVRASISYSRRKAGIRLVGSRNSMGGRSDLAGIDAGVVRAPNYGYRGGKWHAQAVRPGFFSESVQRVGTERMKAASQRAIRAAVIKLGLR